MKLKSICVLLILAYGSLLASPRKTPCPEPDVASAPVDETRTEAARSVDTDILPMHWFSMTVL